MAGRAPSVFGSSVSEVSGWGAGCSSAGQGTGMREAVVSVYADSSPCRPGRNTGVLPDQQTPVLPASVSGSRSSDDPKVSSRFHSGRKLGGTQMNTNDVVISSNTVGGVRTTRLEKRIERRLGWKKGPECGSGRVVMFCVAFHIGVPFDRFPANCGFAQQFANTVWGISNVRIGLLVCRFLNHVDQIGFFGWLVFRSRVSWV